MNSFTKFLKQEQLLVLVISMLISEALQPIVDDINKKLTPTIIKDKLPFISKIIHLFLILIVSFGLFNVKQRLYK